MEKSNVIFFGSFVLAMFIEILAVWFGFSELYTRTGIQGLIFLILWLFGAFIFITGDKWSKREYAKEKLE